MKKILVILAALLIGGCSSTPYWEAVPNWEWNGKYEVVEVDVEMYSTHVSHSAWTLRNPDGSCTITLLKRDRFDRECIVKHELKHCAGWDHPNYPRGFICNPPVRFF